MIFAGEAVDMDQRKTEGTIQYATLGGGCFWCMEVVFQRIEGIVSVISGYAGGTVASPTYEAVCTGNTGHAEVVEIGFDPEVISYEEVLFVFFQAHDPTTPTGRVQM
jgi:peptide-methionine (S)-S-oxide reductase